VGFPTILLHADVLWLPDLIFEMGFRGRFLIFPVSFSPSGCRHSPPSVYPCTLGRVPPQTVPIFFLSTFLAFPHMPIIFPLQMMNPSLRETPKFSPIPSPDSASQRVFSFIIGKSFCSLVEIRGEAPRSVIRFFSLSPSSSSEQVQSASSFFSLPGSSSRFGVLLLSPFRCQKSRNRYFSAPYLSLPLNLLCTFVGTPCRSRSMCQAFLPSEDFPGVPPPFGDRQFPSVKFSLSFFTRRK